MAMSTLVTPIAEIGSTYSTAEVVKHGQLWISGRMIK